MVISHLKEEWKCVAIMIGGVLYVTSNGLQFTLKLCVNIWATVMKVGNIICCINRYKMIYHISLKFFITLRIHVIYALINFDFGLTHAGLLYDAPNTNNIPIIMDFIDCKGSEYSLVDCIHFTHSRGCDHTDDVAIQCQPG